MDLISIIHPLSITCVSVTYHLSFHYLFLFVIYLFFLFIPLSSYLPTYLYSHNKLKIKAHFIKHLLYPSTVLGVSHTLAQILNSHGIVIAQLKNIEKARRDFDHLVRSPFLQESEGGEPACHVVSGQQGGMGVQQAKHMQRPPQESPEPCLLVILRQLALRVSSFA